MPDFELIDPKPSNPALDAAQSAVGASRANYQEAQRQQAEAADSAKPLLTQCGWQDGRILLKGAGGAPFPGGVSATNGGLQSGAIANTTAGGGAIIINGIPRVQPDTAPTATPVVNSIIYLYSVVAGGKLKLYVGGHQPASVFVREFEADQFIATAVIDNRGSSAWNINLWMTGDVFYMIDQTGTALTRTRDLGTILSTQWQCVGWGIWVLQEAIADTYLNTFYSVLDDDLRGGDTVGSEDNNNTISPYWALPALQIVNSSYRAFYRTVRINQTKDRAIGGLINRATAFDTATLKNTFYSGTTISTFTPGTFVPPGIGTVGNYGQYNFDLLTQKVGFSAIPVFQPASSNKWFNGLPEDTDKQIAVGLYGSNFAATGTQKVKVYKPSILGDAGTFTLYNLSYHD